MTNTTISGAHQARDCNICNHCAVPMLQFDKLDMAGIDRLTNIDAQIHIITDERGQLKYIGRDH